MNKNIIKLFAILVMCFMIGAVLVACGAQGEKGDTGAQGAQGPQGPQGIQGEPGGDICENNDHTWDAKVIWVDKHYYDATTGAESAGSYLRACVDCGFAQFVKGEHSFDEGVEVDPTCTEKGGLKKTCSVCNYVKMENEVAALGHKVAVEWNEANIDTTVWIAQPKDANVCAYEQDTVYKAACTREGCTENAETHTVAKIGHKPAVAFNAANIDTTVWVADAKDPQKCDCLEDTTYRAKCESCHAQLFTETVAFVGHVFEDYHYTINDVEAPSCVVDIIEVAECENCKGDKCPLDKRVKTPAPGHTWGAWTVVTAPTATTAGSARRVCTVCESEGYIAADYTTAFGGVENADLAALVKGAEGYTITVTTPSSCVDDEICTFKHNKTGITFTGVKTGDKSGHNIAGAACTEVTAPTKNAGGQVSVACTTPGCGESVTYDVPALGSAYTITKVEDETKECQDIENKYSYTISGNGNVGSTVYDILVTGDYAHSAKPAKGDCKESVNQETGEISYVYLCDHCGHWIVAYVPED